MLYKGNHLEEISFPLGGIGTGSIGLAGNGCLIDWEIFNRPNKGSINPYSFFAVQADLADGSSVTKVLQGDWTKNLSGDYGNGINAHRGFGYGVDPARMCSYPHFRKVRFEGTFPMATLTFEDELFPAKVIMTAFNPFIPLDADNSSLPAAFFDIKIISHRENVKYTVIFSACNPFEKTQNELLKSEKYTAIQMKHYGVKPEDVAYGDLTIAVNSSDGIYQEYWYRGGWRDKVTTFWYDLTHHTFTNRSYKEAGAGDVCSVGGCTVLGQNKSQSFRFVLSWNMPNNYNYWHPHKDAEDKDIVWKNYYATRFADSAATCFYAMEHWNMLLQKTKRFTKALHKATLDQSVIDAVSSSLAVLKSPTVLRLEDGTFYGWEGVQEHFGSCEGTCTHVWSYAYALCFLFPELERSLRDTEFAFDTDQNGKMRFRTRLPLAQSVDEGWQIPACVDGQMATVIKIYRDWKLTGNSEWLTQNWGNVKRILEYAWSPENDHEWDRDKDGVLEGRQHHTLDMELFGPSSWLEGMYLAALKAAAEMAEYLGDVEKAEEYYKVFEKGQSWTKEHLFNGAYFYHKVDIADKSYTEHFNCPNYWNEEKGQLKYQIGEGSIIDQMLGQWHANICGLGDIFDKEQRKIALQNMFKYNFKESFREIANMWRVFLINDEGGTIICDYPEGVAKPVIPIPYCEECMTGFEYAFAGLLISEGFMEEGLKVVRAIRDRYDGEKRNPWNEIECGNNYARVMSSFALLPIFSGFTYHLPKKQIGFSPLLFGDFRCMWNLGTGWGEFVRTKEFSRITIEDGYLEVESVELDSSPVQQILADGKSVSFRQDGKVLSFDCIKAIKELAFIYEE